jgi:hypothetical protein
MRRWKLLFRQLFAHNLQNFLLLYIIVFYLISSDLFFHLTYYLQEYLQISLSYRVFINSLTFMCVTPLKYNFLCFICDNFVFSFKFPGFPQFLQSNAGTRPSASKCLLVHHPYYWTVTFDPIKSIHSKRNYWII